MKVTIEFCGLVFAKFLCVVEFLLVPFRHKNSICIYTTIGTSGYPKGEKLHLAHDLAARKV